MSNGAAGISPAEQGAAMGRRQEEAKRAEEQRRKLAVALENVLGREESRTTDQALVWEYLTGPMWQVCRSLDTNELLIFEGQRRTAAQLLVLVREAGQ